MKQIIAFTGLPGTGKSTLAEALATETGAGAGWKGAGVGYPGGTKWGGITSSGC
ncbi:ATP-binding protein [Kribbella sp. NBC_00709]|uniref:AAA family ATPase n=1 Tax=Kribbella sp. NBC_00709 TaxID=2975972 RepID=UPI002E2CB165|nr:AAA family ATPase [Kribbella sp. NBC_00709]